jgi:hypothetical protein
MIPKTFDYETSTVRSKIISINEESSFIHSNARTTDEACSDSLVKTVSSDSFMDHAYPATFLLTESYDSEKKITTKWDHDSTAASDQKQVLTPYVRLFSDTDDERHADQ